MTSQKLYGLTQHLFDLVKLSDIEKLPKTLMLSGKKGQGKFTLIHHFMAYLYDKKNYDLKKGLISESNKLFKNIKQNYDTNISYFNCNNNNVKIENIRALKTNLQKSSINNMYRFIIFDDVEYLNKNCVNALLKMIEEPSKINYFILINNQRQDLLETLKSRSIEIKIFLNEKEKYNIINNLISDFMIEEKIDSKNSTLTPGNYFKFNKIVLDERIDLNDKIVINIDKLLKLSKIKKNSDYLNFAIFLINQYYFYKYKKESNIQSFNNDRVAIIKKIFESNKLNLNNSNLITELERFI